MYARYFISGINRLPHPAFSGDVRHTPRPRLHGVLPGGPRAGPQGDADPPARGATGPTPGGGRREMLP